MATFNRTDIEFILTQIKMAEAGQPPVNAHLAFGLRTVDGTDNNLVPGQGNYGAADQTFPRMTDPVYQSADSIPGAPGTTPPTSYAAPSGVVFDSDPRTISNLIADQSANNPAAVEAAAAAQDALGTGYQNAYNPATPAPSESSNGSLPITGESLFINNVTPDAGLSAPFNTWMTLFGQFFDHGLDLVTKGGSGTVFIPLQPDDPLYVPGGHTNFMVLTRATNLPGADGVLGTADDVREGTNTITPFVDQSQTYSSHPSHQVFLREYVTGIDGKQHATGRLLGHVNADGSLGMATWADVKANALKLGIKLTDADVGNVPLLATDSYGNLILSASGKVQMVMAPDANHATTWLKEATGTTTTTGAVLTGHAFLNDIANSAVPVFGANGDLAADPDSVAGNAVPMNAQTGQNLQYDNELLDAHYVAGDGRANENIGLTAIHEVFHSEHNRLLEQTKQLIRDELAKGDTSFASEWVLPGADLADGIQEDEWNGERLFQVAKFGTETQYQHLVFEEFARKIAPTIHLFGNVDIQIDAAITAEFAHAVYRFGHSMLDENLNRYEIGADGTPVLDPVTGQPKLNQIGLIQAFLNPLEYARSGANAAGEIALGAVNQVGNEIDEFVTGALRNNLLGLPLDLAALNIARGRDTGVPTLNLVRAEFYSQTHDTSLKPYANWDEFGQYLKHAGSLVNFIAAYGTHSSITGATTLAAKRAAAAALVHDGASSANADAYAFMHSTGVWANDKLSGLALHDAAGAVPNWSTGSTTGLDQVDLWIGGLAEKQNLFGGLLGSTFNFIFETQLENLQDGDRLYYLPRIEGMHWADEIEGNSFADLIMRNTGTRHLPGRIFMTPEYTVEAAQVRQQVADAIRDHVDPNTYLLHNPATGKQLVEVLADGTIHFIGDDNFLGNTMVLGGTEEADRLMAGNADDDVVYGDGGNDTLDGGNGADVIHGGEGDDVVTDTAGDDEIHGEAGNDLVSAGIGDDAIFGDDGNDTLDGGAGIDDILGGLGNDVIRAGEDDDEVIGGEGDDWIEGGLGGDVLVGDSGAPTGDVPLYSGNDVILGGGGGDRMQGFSGDDIMVGTGGFDKFDGRLGFDWASFEGLGGGVTIDMNRKEFISPTGAADAIRDVFIDVEAASGSAHDDLLVGNDVSRADPLNQLDNFNLILGLIDESDDGHGFRKGFFAPGSAPFSGGDILLGGDGSDTIQGGSSPRAAAAGGVVAATSNGNDIIDGDAYLHVGLVRVGGEQVILRQIRYDDTPDNDVDTVVFSDVMANYFTFLADERGFYAIQHINADGTPGADGTDLLRHVERLQFADGTVSFNRFFGVFDADGNLVPDTNAVPTGAVTIAGDTDLTTPIVDPVIGRVLTADASSIVDADGIQGGAAGIHFQWQALDLVKGEWVPIAGATGATFKPTAFFEGRELRVVASFVDGQGYTETLNSAATAVTTLPVAVNTAPFIVPQAALNGIPDTTALQEHRIDYYIPLTTIFNDAQDLPAALHYSARLASGAGLDTVGLSFSFDPATGLGLVSGTPLNGFKGVLNIRVTATDNGPGTPLSVTDTFAINVLPVNHAPVAAVDGPYLINEDTALQVPKAGGVLANDTDPEGDPLAAVLAQGPAHGTVVLKADGSFAYTPDANYAGTDSFTYRASDGDLTSTPTTVTINVRPMDDGPGRLSLSGVLAVGGTLTATLGADPDGPVAAVGGYRWFRDDSVIGGATGNKYTLTAADLGHKISAEETYTDGQGFLNTATSAKTGLVGMVSMGPTADGDGTLLASALLDVSGAALPPGTVSYTWQASNGASGNLPTFKPAGNGTADLSVTVTANYTDPAGPVQHVTSATVHYVQDGGGDSSLTGTGGMDIIFGRGGKDAISGGGGDDSLAGGNGNDSLLGEGGNDSLLGGDGSDTMNGGVGQDTLEGGLGSDTYVLNDDLDTVVEVAGDGSSTDVVQTRLASLTLAANVERLTYTGTGTFAGTGNDGANTIQGGALNDTLVGRGGNDRLNGFAGDDRLDGGTGDDVLIGDDGFDIFVFGKSAAAGPVDFGKDSIMGGFDSNPAGGGQDKLDISGLGITAATFAASVSITASGADTVVTIAGNTITLFGVDVTTMNASDFILAT